MVSAVGLAQTGQAAWCGHSTGTGAAGVESRRKGSYRKKKKRNEKESKERNERKGRKKGREREEKKEKVFSLRKFKI